MDSPLSRSPGSSVLIGVGLPMTRPSSPLGGPHRLEYCWTPPHSSSPPVFVPPAPRPPLLLLLPAPLLLLFQWGECPMGWDAPDPVPPILVWLVPGVACQLVVPPSDWPCAKKRFTSSSPANSARMVVFPSTHLRGDWSTKTNDSWLNALKLTEWNTLNQCADARTCAGTFAPWQLRPWSCSALQHFPVSGWGGMWWGGRVACTVFAESNHQSEKEKTAANGEPAHLILATKEAYFQKLWRSKPLTCGVRFLSTSQLLVLVELSVLHVVPAVHEKETAVKGRSLLACGSYFPSLCETRIKSVKLNGWCQLHPRKKKSWPESVDFNVQPQQDLLEALFLPVLYLYSSPAVVGHIKMPPPMRVYWQPRSHIVL